MVKETDNLRVEKIADSETKKSAMADKVLLVHDGKKTDIGLPYLKNASVELKVLGCGLDDKVRTFKMKAKKRYKRLKCHRQSYTDVQVTKIKA